MSCLTVIFRSFITEDSDSQHLFNFERYEEKSFLPENSLHCGQNSSPCFHTRIKYKDPRMHLHGKVLSLIEVRGLGVESGLGSSVPTGNNFV